MPQILADSVRVEVTAWHGESGGLAEVEVLDKAGENLTGGAKVIASTEHHPGDPRSGATLIDGITESATEKVGYWLLRNGREGWADIRLLPREAPPAAQKTSLATAGKQPSKAGGKARKSLDAKIFALCDDEFELRVNGVSVLEGKQNELFSAGAALATGDVITVKAINTQGRSGFWCTIKFANDEIITASDGWQAYYPADSEQWAQPKQIGDTVPVVRGDSIWDLSEKTITALGVDAYPIWAVGKPPPATSCSLSAHLKSTRRNL